MVLDSDGNKKPFQRKSHGVNQLDSKSCTAVDALNDFICDEAEHHALKSDLIEHMWNFTQ